MRSSDWSSYVCSSDLSTFRSDGRASHRRWPRCACSSVRKGRPSPLAKRSCATAANRVPFSDLRRILSLSLSDDDASPSLIVIALPSELVGQFETVIARRPLVADIRRNGWQAAPLRRTIFLVEYIAHHESRDA